MRSLRAAQDPVPPNDRPRVRRDFFVDLNDPTGLRLRFWIDKAKATPRHVEFVKSLQHLVAVFVSTKESPNAAGDPEALAHD